MSRYDGFLDAFGAAWGSVEEAAIRLQRKVRTSQTRLEEEARAAATEAWHRVDDLTVNLELPGIAPVRRRPYGHGAYMGAAPALLADPLWRRILAFLMPDVYVPIAAAIDRGAAAGELIPMFENNPVMAAYGVWRAAQSADGLVVPVEGLEWDVFVDSALVRTWESAPEAARPAILTRIVDGMVIAHASSTDTVQEQLGLCQYGDVRRTRKTAFGGVEPAAWLDLFGRALELADAADPASAMLAMADEPRVRDGDACERYTFDPPRPASRAIAEFRRVTGQRHLSVVLEIKSLRSTPRLLTAMCCELNARGLRVAAVGSFMLSEIRGVSELIQAVDGDYLPGPVEVLFLHFAGDLQLADLRGELPVGQAVMFNGGSLLHPHGDDYALDLHAIDGIAALVAEKRYVVGLYVQEGDCDQRAADLLSGLVHDRADAFGLGFAWGGLADQAAVPKTNVDRRGLGGQKMLSWVGRAHGWKAPGV